MNRRALFKSIVASVCIGTAQQLGVKPAPLTPDTHARITIAMLNHIYKRLREISKDASLNPNGEAYYTLTKIYPDLHERA